MVNEPQTMDDADLHILPDAMTLPGLLIGIVFSVIAPVDSRLGDRSGQTISGFVPH